MSPRETASYGWGGRAVAIARRWLLDESAHGAHPQWLIRPCSSIATLLAVNVDHGYTHRIEDLL
jgi:hypothetical protein